MITCGLTLLAVGCGVSESGNNKSNVAAVPKRGAGKQQGLGSCPAEETSNKGASVGQGRVPPESQPGAGRNTGAESMWCLCCSGTELPKATAFEDSVSQESHWLSCSTGVGGSSIPPPESIPRGSNL